MAIKTKHYFEWFYFIFIVPRLSWMQCYFIYFSNLCSKPKEIQLQSIMILNKFFRRSLCKRHIRGKKDITSFIISRMIICHQRLVLINLFSNFDRLCTSTQKWLYSYPKKFVLRDQSFPRNLFQMQNWTENIIQTIMLSLKTINSHWLILRIINIRKCIDCRLFQYVNFCRIKWLRVVCK